MFLDVFERTLRKKDLQAVELEIKEIKSATVTLKAGAEAIGILLDGQVTGSC
jgi:hypothetical protein